MARIYVNLRELAPVVRSCATVAGEASQISVEIKGPLPPMPARVDADVRAAVNAAAKDAQRFGRDAIEVGKGLQMVSELFERASADTRFRPLVQALDQYGGLHPWAMGASAVPDKPGSAHGSSPSAMLDAIALMNAKLGLDLGLADFYGSGSGVGTAVDVLGHVGTVLDAADIAFAAGGQLHEDWGDPTIPSDELTERAALQGGVALGAAATGAASGAAIGSVVPVAGTAVGAFSGAVIGFGVGYIGEKGADAALDYSHQTALQANDFNAMSLSIASLQVMTAGLAIA